MSPNPDYRTGTSPARQRCDGTGRWFGSGRQWRHKFRPALKPQYKVPYKNSRQPTWRRLTVLLLVFGFLALSQPVADAAPADVNTVPDNLRQYVAGTPEWDTSPWMTTPDRKAEGGDWSVHPQRLLKDPPALLQVLR